MGVEERLDGPAAAAVGAGGDFAPVEGGAFTHADQATAASGAGAAVCSRGAGRARVVDGDAEGIGGDGDADSDRRVGGGVLDGVGECLLDDAVGGQLEAGCHTGEVAPGVQDDGGAGGAHALQQCVEVGEAGLRGQRGFVRPVVVLADDGEQAAQFGQNLTAAVADDAECLGSAFGFGFGECGGTVGEADDDGEGVAEDVVPLAGVCVLMVGTAVLPWPPACPSPGDVRAARTGDGPPTASPDRGVEGQLPG